MERLTIRERMNSGRTQYIDKCRKEGIKMGRPSSYKKDLESYRCAISEGNRIAEERYIAEEHLITYRYVSQYHPKSEGTMYDWAEWLDSICIPPIVPKQLKIEVNHWAKDTSKNTQYDLVTTLRKKNAPNLAKFCFIRYWRPMAYTRTNRVWPVAIGFMTDTMGRMHSDAQFAGSSSVKSFRLFLLRTSAI